MLESRNWMLDARTFILKLDAINWMLEARSWMLELLF
jgi:hypothetical protein